jgi:Ca-activated chloride channel family protein
MMPSLSLAIPPVLFGLPLHIEHPAFLWALPLLVPLALLTAVRYRRCFPLIKRLLPSAATAAIHAKSLATLHRRAILCRLFFGLFLFAMILALAGIFLGTRRVAEPRYGAAVVMAMDVSRSMDVRDVPPFAGNERPSRLERSVRTAENLVAAFETANETDLYARFAVVIGKSRAVTAIPLSTDLEALFSLFDSLSSAMLSSKSTNLENLIDSAAACFSADTPSRRLILLFSDGDAQAGALEAALERAYGKGISVIAAGAGSVEGGVVTGAVAGAIARDNDTAPGLSGATDTVYESALRSDALREALARYGGVYIDANTDEAAATLGALIRAASAAGAWSYREERAGTSEAFALAAFACLLISALSRYRTVKINPKPHTETRSHGGKNKMLPRVSA